MIVVSFVGMAKKMSNICFFNVFTRKVGRSEATKWDQQENGSWEEELSNAIKDGRGDTFEAKIKCMSRAATVYFIWQEKNAKDDRHICEYVI